MIFIQPRRESFVKPAVSLILKMVGFPGFFFSILPSATISDKLLFYLQGETHGEKTLYRRCLDSLDLYYDHRDRDARRYGTTIVLGDDPAPGQQNLPFAA